MGLEEKPAILVGSGLQMVLPLMQAARGRVQRVAGGSMLACFSQPPQAPASEPKPSAVRKVETKVAVGKAGVAAKEGGGETPESFLCPVADAGASRPNGNLDSTLAALTFLWCQADEEGRQRVGVL